MKPFSLNKFHLILGSILFSYLIIGLSARFTPEKEIFPIYSWFLFSRVPGASPVYDIVILEHNGQPLNPPISFFQAPGTLVQNPSITARRIINNFGKAYEKQNPTKIKHFQSLLEKNHLSSHITYALIRESFDPIEKFKTGASQKKQLTQFKLP